MNSKAIKNFFANSFSSLAFQFINIIIVLLTRNILLKYIGVELLGVNSTLNSLINAFSLTELGFQSVIIYNLYKPLNEKDYDQINKIMTIYRTVYISISLFVFIAGILCIPFLSFFLNGIIMTSQIMIMYVILLINVGVSYLLSYKRTLLYADNKDYYSKIIDMILKVVTSLLKIIVLIYTKNIIYYLIVDVVYTIVSNFIVHIYCNKLFPYLIHTKFDTILFRNIFRDVKNVFLGKISSYIYSSTDNLVISSIIGPSAVTLLTNYSSLILQLKSVVNSVLYPIIPIIGRNISKDNSDDSNELFINYTYIRYFFAGTLIIPTYILIDDFIVMWIGEKYLLSNVLVILILLDFYISIVYAPCYEFNNSKGLFLNERNIMGCGAILNIVISIILAKLIGINGVLVGTVISQAFLWIFRSKICFDFIIDANKYSFLDYWIDNFKNIFLIIFVIGVLSVMKLYLFTSISIINFIIWGCISVIFYWCIFILVYKNSKLIGMIKSNMKKIVKIR